MAHLILRGDQSMFKRKCEPLLCPQLLSIISSLSVLLLTFIIFGYLAKRKERGCCFKLSFLVDRKIFIHLVQRKKP